LAQLIFNLALSSSVILAAYLTFELSKGLVPLLRHQTARRTWSWRGLSKFCWRQLQQKQMDCHSHCKHTS